MPRSQEEPYGEEAGPLLSETLANYPGETAEWPRAVLDSTSTAGMLLPVPGWGRLHPDTPRHSFRRFRQASGKEILRQIPPPVMVRRALSVRALLVAMPAGPLWLTPVCGRYFHTRLYVQIPGSPPHHIPVALPCGKHTHSCFPTFCSLLAARWGM